MGDQPPPAAAPPVPTPLDPPPSAPPQSRRTVLKILATAAAGAGIGIGVPALVGRSIHSAATSWRYLTPDEAHLVDLITEQIIPADHDPGAHDAGVVHFIDRLLAEAPTRLPPDRVQLLRERYHTGLASLQFTAQELFAAPFDKLPWDKQTQLLQALEANKVPARFWTTQPASGFFDMLRSHTMQGFYGSPRHGGNRNYASYRMLGLEYPRVMGRNAHT